MRRGGAGGRQGVAGRRPPPGRGAAGGGLVDDALQLRLGFSDHAIERFGERAGLPVRSRMALEPVLRDLLTQEGRMVARRPGWARSDNTADAYVQVGERLLLICRHDVRRPGAWTVVTVLNRTERMSWERALERGLVGTPPPLASGPPKRARIGVVAAIRAAAAGRAGAAGRGERRGLLAVRIAAELRAGRAEAGREYREQLADYEERRAEWEERRRVAHAAHMRRHGA